MPSIFTLVFRWDSNGGTLVSPKVSTLALRERYLRTLLRSLGHHVTWNLRIGEFFPPARGDNGPIGLVPFFLEAERFANVAMESM